MLSLLIGTLSVAFFNFTLSGFKSSVIVLYVGAPVEVFV